VMTAAIVFGGQRWVLVPLTYGFLARVLTGPKLSPLGSIVTKIVVPRLGLSDKPVPGKPKRFAQGIGAVLSTAALVSWLLGTSTPVVVFAVMILGAALLEAGIGYCLGCVIYGQLSKWGIVPDACPECADITLRPRRVAA
jgi:Domain of unknown function (DUF4395)